MYDSADLDAREDNKASKLDFVTRYDAALYDEQQLIQKNTCKIASKEHSSTTSISTTSKIEKNEKIVRWKK